MSMTADRASDEREDLLRAAIREAVGADDDFSWGSLYGLIHSDRDRQILREETAPEQVLLDMHLTGSGVDGHATSAARFARFVKRVSEATKYTARQIAGTDSYSERLLIEGVGPGSVRIVLRVPDQDGLQAEKAEGTESESADSTALRRISRIFTNASSDDGGESLVAQVHDLPQNAQRAIKSAVTEVLRAGWQVDGEVLRRRQPIEEMRLSKQGAARLNGAIEFKPGPPESEARVGNFDGHRTSRGIAYFIPRDGDGVAFSAAVHDEDLLRRIAWIDSQRDDHGNQITVRAIFDRFLEPAEAGVSSRHSRSLRDFEILTNLAPDQTLL
jgi:hypothetical protein